MKYNDFLFLRKSICVIIWVVNWTQHFIHEIYFFFLKEGKTQYGYSDLGIWQTFSQKQVKWVYHFGENNYLMPMIQLKF